MDTETHIRGSRIMVTGGCGFIGSHLVERLLQMGARRIIILDRSRHGNRDHLPVGDVRVVTHALGTDPSEDLDAALNDVDLLFHLAAEKHQQAREAPLAAMRANVEGTYALLAAAARRGVRKVVYSSSLYAHGRTHSPPMSEDELPQPTTVYGISKLAGEHLLAHRKHESGLDYVALRYFFVYGPRQLANLGYKSVIVKNFERLIAGEPATIHGDGEQSLDYVYVDDVIEATVRAMEAPLSRGVLNVGSGRATKINALIDTMIAVSGRSSSDKLHLPPDWTAGSYRVARIDKIKDALAWVPTTTLEDGLRHTYAWMSAKAPRDGATDWT